MNLIYIFASRKKHIENIIHKMTKAEIVSKISDKLGIEKGDVQATVESFMEEVKTSLESGDNVYLRGFGSFIIKTRAEKTGRNISKNTTIKIPAHNIPAFKPAKVFVEGVKSNVQVK
jgi:DNA-binding protein HU-beta